MQSKRRIHHPNNHLRRPRWLSFGGGGRNKLIGAFVVALALKIYHVPNYNRGVIDAINAGHQRASTGEKQTPLQTLTQSRTKYHRTTSWLHPDASERVRQRLAETRLGALEDKRRSSNDDDAREEDESGPDYGGLTIELPAPDGVRSITKRGNPFANRKPHVRETNDAEDKEELIASLFSRFQGDNCVPFHPYQTSSYPNCNVVHETSFADPNEVALAGKGTQSIVFHIPDAVSTATSEERKRLIVKTQLYWKNIEYDRMEQRRRDTVIQEHASSPYITSLYGFCGMGTLAAMADDGRVLYDFVASVRRGGAEPDPLTKLKVAVQLAMGQSALHKIGVCHNDYDMSQIVYVDGIMKLSDFVSAKMIPRDATDGPSSHETCKGSSGAGHCRKYRAPEDLRQICARGKPFHMDKADVFSLGSALYMFVTNQWLWEGERRRKSARRLMNGKRPEVPERIGNSTSECTRAILKALDMCWTFDPDERPSSTEVASYLLKELKRLDDDTSWMKENGGDGIVRVTMPSENFVMGDDDDWHHYEANM